MIRAMIIRVRVKLPRRTTAMRHAYMMSSIGDANLVHHHQFLQIGCRCLATCIDHCAPCGMRRRCAQAVADFIG